MSDSFDSAPTPRDASLLWVNLTRQARTALGESGGGAFDVHRVREPGQIPAAIQRHAPQFLCFEFDEPDSACVNALAHTRETPGRFTPPADQALSALHGPAKPGRTHPAIAHVVRHFDCKIALQHAAALCRLSPSQFCRVFKQEQGMSFGQHLLRYRLDRACEGLTHAGALVKEVAYAVGFNDLSYFSRAFKRQLGVCPSDYQAGAG